MTPDASEPGAPTGEPGSQSSGLAALGQLADLDVRLEQIDHHVEHLPERETRTGIAAELAKLAAETRMLAAQIGDLERQQRKQEDEVARIEAKRAHNSERLYESHLTSPKEAEALTAEAVSLKRRQMEIEDQILELMEQLEPLSSARADLEGRHAAATEHMAAVDAAIADAESEASTQHNDAIAEREALVGSADPALVSIYEERRAIARGAPVVGRLVGTTCSACHLEVSSVDFERIMHLEPDELVECPQCGALLVR
ncbi:zinc ribbon domain-containing protein [Candidatus Poriferisodalis sp.]|uniref:zinc ribbon domain-containing protein n=1 Tax=Candidatus Poriferisodalis sp. TaxID=3101277 RepID=UPI003B51E6EE